MVICDPRRYLDLINVFEVFLPQLLLYPNPTDPLNGEAASLLMREPETYNGKVKGVRLPESVCMCEMVWMCRLRPAICKGGRRRVLSLQCEAR